MQIATAGRLGAAAMATLLTACGGGSGGGGGGPVPLTNADFTGPYFQVHFAGIVALDNEGYCSTGILTADGIGGWSRTFLASSMGSVVGPVTEADTYGVGPGGLLEFHIGGPITTQGGLTSDGACALVGRLPPFRPGVVAAFRREGTLSTASLSGLYRIVVISATSGTNDTEAFTGPMTFDGAGGASSGGLRRNFMGATTTIAGAFTYSVAADGASTATLGGSVYSGGVVEGGALAVWGGPTIPAGNPALIVAIRSASGSSDATLQGDYWIVRMVRDIVADGYASDHGSLTADGAGGASYQFTTNVEAAASSSSGTAAYSVDATGRLSMGLVQGLWGGITQDGRFAVLGGAEDAGTNPTLCLLVRK